MDLKNWENFLIVFIHTFLLYNPASIHLKEAKEYSPQQLQSTGKNNKKYIYTKGCKINQLDSRLSSYIFWKLQCWCFQCVITAHHPCQPLMLAGLVDLYFLMLTTPIDKDLNWRMRPMKKMEENGHTCGWKCGKMNKLQANILNKHSKIETKFPPNPLGLQIPTTNIYWRQNHRQLVLRSNTEVSWAIFVVQFRTPQG